MLLLIDAGNTRIKWALLDNAAAPAGIWLASGAVTHAGLMHLGPAWQAALGGKIITRVLLANVAGGALRARLEQALPSTLAPAAVSWFASLPQLAGVRNAYRDPAQLGCDRFAAAIGAHALAPGQAVIAATCGTATTIDAITADGVFLGGMIIPGLDLMAKSLVGNTARLPHIGQDFRLATGFADTTDDGIASGCLAAQAGAIERAFAAHGATQCILSGGAAQRIAPALAVPYRLIDNIVLVGLHTAIKSQAPGSAC